MRFDPGTEGYDIVAVGSDSSVVVKNNQPNKDQFTTINASGDLGASFGLPAPLGRKVNPLSYTVELGVSALPGSFWAGSTFYQIEMARWSTDGERLSTFAPIVDWYPPYDSTALAEYHAVGAEALRPLPFLRAIHETADGVLWLAFSVAAFDWQPDSIETVELRSRSGEVIRRGGSRPEHFDGVLTAFNSASGEHLLTIRTADVVAGFANDTLAFARRTGPDDVPQIALFRFGLQR